MKAIKKPIPIEVVAFHPADRPSGLPSYVLWRNGGSTFSVFNVLHNAWIDVKPGDYLNVTDHTGQDIYPIDRATFERTYDVIQDLTQLLHHG